MATDLSAMVFIPAIRRLPRHDTERQWIADGRRRKGTPQDDWRLEHWESSHANKGMEWKFITPPAAHQNRCAEALVKNCKIALKKAIGDHNLTPVCLLEVANLANQRPIGESQTIPMIELICVRMTCCRAEPPLKFHKDPFLRQETQGEGLSSFRR